MADNTNDYQNFGIYINKDFIFVVQSEISCSCGHFCEIGKLLTPSNAGF